MVPERLFAHLPWALLEETLPFLVENRLQPEIAFQGPDLDRTTPQALEAAGEALAVAGLRVTVHAPFHDLNPGALEPLVFEATRRRYLETLEAAGRLGASLVVFHPGYEFWKYGGRDHLWVDRCRAFWPTLIDRASRQRCRMALENIFDTVPSPLVDLLNEFDTPWLGHCFDVGHWHLFGRASLPEWFERFGRRIIHLHLHDNCGLSDDHLPIGEGNIDFGALARHVGALEPRPSVTLEAHSREALLRSLKGAAPFLTD